MRKYLTLLLAISLIALAACEQETPDTEEPPAEEEPAEEVPEPHEDEPEEAAEDPRQQQAMAAIFDLRDTLMGRVMEVATEESYEAAVHVCRDEAIPLTEEAAQRHDVELGRTSDRLRNQDNTAPDWFDELADQATEGPHFAEGPAGELRGVAPIRLAEACANCHGTEDQLADGVAEALDAHYPEDQATGYEPGDLRGFFWVEVAADQ